MAYLIDANIIIRFLIGDDEDKLQESKELFEAIERGSIDVIVSEGIVMEAYFMLTKFYDLPKSEVIEDLKAILALEGVVNADKMILFEALTICKELNIDFMDALLCAKAKLQGHQIISYDKDIKRCMQ